MQTTQQSLMHPKVKGIALKAIMSIICSFLAFIPSLNLASWILFLFVLYELKIYGGAKNLFKNFFISIAIYLSVMLIGTMIIYFIMLNSYRYSFSQYGFDIEDFLPLILIAIATIFLATTLSFKFIKAFFYELARVSKQKYFIYAFWAFLIGLYTLVFFGLGALFILASVVLCLIGWVNFKEFAQENKEFQIQTSNLFTYFNLKSIKTLMIISFTLELVFALYYLTRDFIPYRDGEFSLYFLVIFFYLTQIAFILALIAIILLCEKLKSHKIFTYFIVWQIVIMLSNYIVSFINGVYLRTFRTYFDLDSEMPLDLTLFLNVKSFFDLELSSYFLNLLSQLSSSVSSILLIILSFFFFRTLIKETNNTLFFGVFLAYALNKISNIILYIVMFGVKLDSIFSSIPYFASLLFLVVYNILAIVAWSRFKLKTNS